MRTAYRTCPLCEATCGLEITLDGDDVVQVRGDAQDVFSRGFLCPKGVALRDLHEDPDRLRTPLVRGAVLKGPTDAFLRWAGRPLSSDGIVDLYDGLLDGLVADERTDALPVLETDVAMPDAAGRRRVAAEALDFALALAPG